jgi:hypothetical protein
MDNRTGSFIGFVDPKYKTILPTAVEVDCHNSTTQYMVANGKIFSQNAHGVTVKHRLSDQLFSVKIVKNPEIGWSEI